MKKFIGYELYVVDCENGGYSMADKSLRNHNIQGNLIKQYSDKNKTFVFSVFNVYKFNEQDLINALYELKNTFYILNNIQEFNNAVNYIETKYNVKIKNED